MCIHKRKDNQTEAAIMLRRMTSNSKKAEVLIPKKGVSNLYEKSGSEHLMNHKNCLFLLIAKSSQFKKLEYCPNLILT